MRSIEEGIPMARAANTGISAVIDARGRIVASLALGRRGVVDAALPQALPPTPYARFGDLGFAVLLLISLVVSLAVRRPR
jgi:apolipoprotein N-acyltransferase